MDMTLDLKETALSSYALRNIDSSYKGSADLFKFLDVATEFEDLLYGLEPYYRDHTLHSLWVYLLGDSWCYGLSPDIPWSFEDQNETDMWFRHADNLKKLLGDLVQAQYWDAIDCVRQRF